MGMLEREMKNLARQAGGSHKTVHDRIAMAGRFCDRLMALNVQIRYVHHLKAKHIEAYIQMRRHRAFRNRRCITKRRLFVKYWRRPGATSWRRASGYPINRWGWLAYPATARAVPSRRNIISRYWKTTRLKDAGLAAATGAGPADGIALAGSGALLPVTAHLAGSSGAR